MQMKQWRNVAFTAGSFLAGATAAVGFTATHAVDLYELIKQLNVVVVEVTKFVSLAAPVIIGIYQAIKLTRKSMIAEVAAVPGTVVRIPEQAIADALPRNVRGPEDAPVKL